MERVTAKHHEGVLLRTDYRLHGDDQWKCLVSRQTSELRPPSLFCAMLLMLEHSHLAQARLLQQQQLYQGWTPTVRAFLLPARKVRGVL